MSGDNGRGWNGRSRGGRTGYLIFIRTVRFAGLRCAYGLLAAVVVYYMLFAPRAVGALWHYYRRSGRGRLRAAGCIYRHFYRFGQTLIDRLAVDAGMASRFGYEFENYDRFIEILDSGRGVIMIGAHVGCWQAGATFFGDYASRINVVMLDAEYRRIRELIDETARRRSYKVIAVDENDALSSVLAVKSALDRGEYVCFQGDRWLREDKVLVHRFMGAEARFPLGPFLTAARMKAPVVFYYAMRERGRRYRFIFREAPDAADEKTLLGSYVASLEDIVERYPDQWFNFYDFWK